MTWFVHFPERLSARLPFAEHANLPARMQTAKKSLKSKLKMMNAIVNGPINKMNNKILFATRHSIVGVGKFSPIQNDTIHFNCRHKNNALEIGFNHMRIPTDCSFNAISYIFMCQFKFDARNGYLFILSRFPIVLVERLNDAQIIYK